MNTQDGSMITGAWEYCGRFSVLSQEPVPMAGLDRIDEDEARRRYATGEGELTALAPVDPVTGIRPYFVVITSGARPSFTVVEQRAPGVEAAEARWANTPHGLFLSSATFYEWPPEDEIVSRSLAKWTTRSVMKNRIDGTGSLMIVEQGSNDVTTAKRTFDAAALFRPVPEWGRWETLRESAVRP